MKEKIHVFITLYHPDVISPCFLNQVDNVFLLGNSEVEKHLLENLPSTYHYIRNEKNLGLSAAFNKALMQVNMDDDDYVLFFDQDSEIPDDFVKKLIFSFVQCEKKYNVGIIGANFKDINTGKVTYRRIKTRLESAIYKVPSLITSSMLTRFKYLKKINYWNENIFLDFADFELCYRYRKAKLLCAVDESIFFSHRLGESQSNKVHYLKSFRYYYVVRDTLKILFSSPITVYERFSYIKSLFFLPISILFFEDRKKERLFFYVKGFRDGIKKINGELVY